MDSATFKKLICDIEDIIFIENRIVTCVSLCQELKIHVNVAKQLLHAFIHKDDDIEDKVSVVYILGGQLKNGSGIQIKLVEKNGYEEAISEFSKLTANHVYSIQKSIKDPINFISLYHAYPHFSPDERKFCAIQPKKEVDKRDIKVAVVEISKEPVKPAIKVSKPVASNTKLQENGTVHPKEKKTSPEKIELPAKSNKGVGIAGMFSRQAEKNKIESSKKAETKAENKKSGSLSGFLQMQTSKSKKEIVAVELMDTDSDLPIKEVNNKFEDTDKERDTIKENNTNGLHEADKSTVKEKSSVRGKENRNKRKKKDEGKDESQKKRRRIVRMSSSESEQSGNDSSDCEMESEPTSAPVAAADEEEDIIPPTPGRKRVRKQVDKTYVDDDGFILTKKEYIYESCTDDEGSNEKVETEHKEATKTKMVNKVEKQDEIKKKEEDNKKDKAKKSNENKNGHKKSPAKKQRLSANSNNKSSKQQASITNFFRKKNT